MFSAPNISVLPPELLENTFNLTIQSISAQDRAFQTLAFSHVCRTFRDVALNSPRLWASLPGRQEDGFSRPAFIEACIERSRDLPMDVALWVHYTKRNEGATSSTLLFFDSTFDRILLHCARWRSCSLHIDHMRESSPDGKYHTLSDFETRFGQVDAPLLEELLIETAPGIYFVSLLMLLNITWNVPSLENFTLCNTLFAILSDFCSQLRTFAIKFCEYSGDPILQEGLSKVINVSKGRMAAMTSLTTFQVSFVDCICDFSGDYTVSLAEMPSVEFVDITLLGCTKASRGTDILWKEFRKFYFPNAIELAVTLDIGDGDELVLWKGHNIALYSLLAPSPDDEYQDRYPSLELLAVDIHSNNQPPSPHSNNEPPQLPTMLLPCCCIPSLKHLKICSSAAHWKLLDGVGEFDASSQPPYFRRAGEVTAISLETATFDVPDVDGIVPWMKQLTSKMRATSCWERFSELTIIQSGDEVVVPRDNVGRWCEDNS